MNVDHSALGRPAAPAPRIPINLNENRLHLRSKPEGMGETSPWYRTKAGMLLLLSVSPHTYRGTANPRKVRLRRAKNKVAKQSRKVNR